MNAIWPRFLRTAYRREPISSFVVIVGAVDALMGGVGDRGSLTIFGVGTVGLALILRWWLIQQSRQDGAEPVPQRYLPSRSSSAPLPTLSGAKRNPPR